MEMNPMKTGLELDYETADKITVLNLLDQLEFLQNELNAHRNGDYMHKDDAYNSEFKLVPALKTILQYYGEDV